MPPPRAPRPFTELHCNGPHNARKPRPLEQLFQVLAEHPVSPGAYVGHSITLRGYTFFSFVFESFDWSCAVSTREVQLGDRLTEALWDNRHTFGVLPAQEDWGEDEPREPLRSPTGLWYVVRREMHRAGRPHTRRERQLLEAVRPHQLTRTRDALTLALRVRTEGARTQVESVLLPKLRPHFAPLATALSGCPSASLSLVVEK